MPRQSAGHDARLSVGSPCMGVSCVGSSVGSHADTAASQRRAETVLPQPDGEPTEMSASLRGSSSMPVLGGGKAGSGKAGPMVGAGAMTGGKVRSARPRTLEPLTKEAILTGSAIVAGMNEMTKHVRKPATADGIVGVGSMRLGGADSVR